MGAEARAMEGFGKSVQNAGDNIYRIADHQRSETNTLDETKAQSGFLTKIATLDEERKNLTDPEEADAHKPKYTQALNEAASIYSDPKRAEIFRLKYAPFIAGRETATNDKQFELNKDREIAHFNYGVEQLTNDSIKSNDPALKSANLKAIQAQADALHSAGYLDDTQHQKALQGTTVTYVRKNINSMTPEDRLKAFGVGVNPADLAGKYAGFNEKTHASALTELFRKTGGQAIDPSETAWCAAYVDAILGASGKKQAKTLRAADFLKYGTPTEQPTKGDVVVFAPQAAGASGHVGFVIGIEGDRVRYIAGNDGNRVRENTLPLSEVRGFRVPPPANTPIDGLDVNGENPKRIADEANKTGKRNPIVDFLPADEHQGIIAGARAEIATKRRQELLAGKQDAAHVSTLMEDDLKSIEKTGQGMPPDKLSRERVLKAHGEHGVREWEADRVRNRRVFETLDGIETLPEGEVEQRLRNLEPKPGIEGYTEDAKTVERARKKADAFLQARRADPALAVDAFDTVKQARTSAKYTESNGVRVIDPSSAQAIIQARLKAQDHLGIDNPMAVTVSEARVISRQLRAIGQDNEDGMRVFMKKLKDTYGDYAPHVLSATLQHAGVNRELSNVATEILGKLDAGLAPTPVDAKKVEDLTDASAIDGALKGKRRSAMGRDYQQRVIDQNNPASGTQAGARENAAAGELSAQLNPTKRILSEHTKGLWTGEITVDEFNSAYGPGSAEKAVKEITRITGKPWIGASGKPPQAPPSEPAQPAKEPEKPAQQDGGMNLGSFLQSIIGALSDEQKSGIVSQIADKQIKANRKPDDWLVLERDPKGRVLRARPIYNE